MTHTLVVTKRGEEWHVEHPPTCPVIRVGRDYRRLIVLMHDCLVADELYYAGLDSLDVDWTTLPEGEHAIEAWAHEYPGGPWGPTEWDTGLRLMGDER